MPAIFVGHGSPMNAILDNPYAKAWARRASAIPKPRAILSISAHWYTRGTAVTGMNNPKTIHDFGGFPAALFAVQYPAPGDPALAASIRSRLDPLPVQLDQSWGLDHGTWQVLVHMYPQAEIPVVQLSIDATQPAQFHYDLGSRLETLRNEGVLILGSGNIVHNLGLMSRREGAPAFDWARRFSRHVRDCVMSGDHAGLIEFERQGEDARLSIPTPEHYLPLLYVLGTQRAQDTPDVFVEGSEYGSLDMMSVAV